VNNGSGCIFQPEDDAYSYILTAKHNIVNKEITKLTRFILQDKAWKSKAIRRFTAKAELFPHPKKDIAIIKIPKIAGLDNIFRLDDFENDTTGYALCGYPDIRKTKEKNDTPYRIDTGVTILGTGNNQLREAQIPGNPNREEIVGQSGGAIVKLKDNALMLVGIQNKMMSQDERLGRVEFTTLDSFDEIVKMYPNDLSPLSPVHFKSFKFLKDQVMRLEGCFYDIGYTKRCLQDLTDDITRNPLTPQVIKNRLRERLLIHNENESSLYNKGLWVAWLELLIILRVIGIKPQSKQELDDIFNQYRIIYSSSKQDWSFFIQEILRSDYKGLKENACIIVYNERKPGKWLIGKGILQDISRKISKKEMTIDEGAYRPLDSYKHIHLSAFQQNCIVEKEEEFINFDNSNEEELFEKLKKEYECLINNN